MSAYLDFEDLAYGAIPGESITLESQGVNFTISGEGLAVHQLNFDYYLTYRLFNTLRADGFQGPITVEFDQAVSSVSFLNPVNGLVSPEVDEIHYDAFDIGDNLLKSGVSSAETISFSAAGIRRIVLAAPETGFVFGPLMVDLLTPPVFDVIGVPAPAALPLMLAGTSVFGFIGWRRRRTH